MTVSNIEIIARVLVFDHGRILAARHRNKQWYFLPGGHVEPGEPIQAALTRELVEELGFEEQGPRLVGVVEHGYQEDGTDHHELNLVFESTLPTTEVTSREDQLELAWLTVPALTDTDLRPARLKDALLQWTETGELFWRGMP